MKATKHRVLDIGIDRYSSPFFFEPRYAARIPTTLMNEGELESDKDEEKLIYGDWLIEKMREFAEYKHF